MRHALEHDEVLVEMARCLFFSTSETGLAETSERWGALSPEQRDEWCDLAVERMRAFAFKEGPDPDPDDDPDPGASRPDELESVRAA